MRYKGKVYRPPSEAYSLIVQVTYGCSHNRCAFCDMYDDKHFAMRPMDEIREDFELARRVYRRVERVFLADGDALMRRTGDLVEILGLVYGLFPECQRVTCYASPTSLQIKSEDELRLLRSKGLQGVQEEHWHGREASLSRVAAGHGTGIRGNQGDAARGKGRTVGLRGRIHPHARIHGRSGQHGAAESENLRMKHFSGQSRGHGGQSVGRGGDHEERVGVLAGFEMTEGGVPVCKHVRIHGKSAEGLEEQGRNETPRRGRERVLRLFPVRHVRL